MDIDISLIDKFKEKMKESNIKSINVVQGDARELPFRKDKFDLVILREVIEHVETNDAETILKNIYRVLKPGGVLLMSTPNRCSPEGIISGTFTRIKWNAWDPTHKHIYNYSEIKKLLDNNNFVIEEVRGEYYFFNLLLFISFMFSSLIRVLDV